VICQREALWVLSGSGSEKSEAERVGVKLLTVAPCPGDILTGVLGGAATTASGLSRGNASAVNKSIVIEIASHLPSPLHFFITTIQDLLSLIRLSNKPGDCQSLELGIPSSKPEKKTYWTACYTTMKSSLSMTR